MAIARYGIASSFGLKARTLSASRQRARPTEHLASANIETLRALSLPDSARRPCRPSLNGCPRRGLFPFEHTPSGKAAKPKIGHALQKKPRSRWEAAGGASVGR